MKRETLLTKYESSQLAEIKAWKTQEPSVMAAAVGYVLKPLEWIVSKVIPTSAIKGILLGANKIAEMTADEGDILRDAGVATIEDMRNIELQKCDDIANEVHNWAVGIAGTEGGITGAFGLPGIAADIPLTITLALRTIHKIGLCYGFRLDDESSIQIIFGILGASGANTMEEKIAALLTLQQIKVIVQKTTWKGMARTAENMFTKEAGILAVKTIGKQLGINMTKRKTLQAIPIIGAIVGASVNAWYIKDVAWAARREFQELWLVNNAKISPIEIR